MNLTGNTVLITGGSSGLGLELSKELVRLKNNVIICGRSDQKLEQAKQKIPGLEIYQCDLSTEAGCIELAEWIKRNHPGLNVLVNNAALVHKTNFMEDDQSLAKAEQEIQTNLVAPVRLSKLLYPVINSNRDPVIINITTGLAFVPRAVYPIYNATKAALHSFTKVIRHQLAGGNIKIIEVMFPAVDTPWHSGNPPKIAISPEKAIYEMIKGLQKGKAEIKVGKVKLIYALSRIAPNFAFRKINRLK